MNRLLSRSAACSAGLAGLLSLATCGGQPGPGLSLRLAAAPLSGSGCVSSNGQPVPNQSLGGLGGSVRLSVVAQQPGQAARFLCDITASVPDQKDNLDLGQPQSGGTFDVHAEYFDNAGNRVAAGALFGLSTADLTASSLPLFLYRASTWSCPAGTVSAQHAMNAPRAFHSSTALPGGQVLLIGGMSPDASNGAGAFLTRNDAEFFDPATGTFSPVTINGAQLTSQAFHQVVLLGQSGTQVSLLLFGGLTATDITNFAGSSQAQFRLSWQSGNAAPVSLLTYDTAAHTLTVQDQPPGKFTPAMFAGGVATDGGVLLVGGQNTTGGASINESSTLLSPALGASFFLPGQGGAGGTPVLPVTQLSTATASLVPWLLAPSVVPLSSGALVIGAARSAPGAAPAATEDAFQVSGLPGAVTTSTVQVLSSFNPPTAFNTTTLLTAPSGTSQVLLTGGFQFQVQSPIQALDPPAPVQAVRTYNLALQGAPTETQVSVQGPGATCGSATAHYRPAGYEAASATLSGQRAVISGGGPRQYLPLNGPCVDCETGDSLGPMSFCTLGQTSIYDSASGTLTATAPLGLPRLGHRQSLLPDGSILATGGISRSTTAGTAPVTTEAEVFNPRASGLPGASPDVDDPLAPLLAAQGLTRTGTAAVKPCNQVK